MDITKLNPSVLGAIRQQLGASSNSDDSHDDEISELSVEEAFDRWLRWNGIIGFTYNITTALDNIREANKRR